MRSDIKRVEESLVHVMIANRTGKLLANGRHHTVGCTYVVLYCIVSVVQTNDALLSCTELVTMTESFAYWCNHCGRIGNSV